MPLEQVAVAQTAQGLTAFAAPADARVLSAAIGDSTFTPGTYKTATAVGIAIPSKALSSLM
jgi:hypothetical protein